MSTEDAAVEVKDGRILIDGVDQGLEVAHHQGLRMTVTGLRKSRTVQMLDGRRLDDTRIHGMGILDGTLGSVGASDKVKAVAVVVQSAPTGEERLDWHTYVGYSADDEFPDDTPWAVQARLPPEVWAMLIAEFDAGRVQRLSMDVDGGMWSKPTPFFHDPRPHLMLPPKGGGAGHAIAKTISITWGTEIVTMPDEAAAPLTTSGAGRVRQLLTWGLPAIVGLLAIIAART